MSNQTKPASEKTTVSLHGASHHRATIAAALVSQNLLEFLSKAADERSIPILKKHGVKIPSDSAVN